MAGIFKKKYDSDDYHFLGFKTKIYPTKEQIEYFNCCFGITRLAYNWYLDKAEDYYKINGKCKSYTQMRKEFGNLATANPKYWFIYETVNSRIWHSALGNANSAYNLWYQGVSKKPKKHKKRDSKQNFSLERCIIKSNYKFYIAGINEPGKHFITGYNIKTAENISFLKNVTVSKITISYNGVNYFASFDYRILKTEFYENDKKLERFYHPRKPVVGIDLGLKLMLFNQIEKLQYFQRRKF